MNPLRTFGDRVLVAVRLLRMAFGAVVHTLPLGVLSLGLAVLVWVTVTHEQNPSIRRAIPIEIPVEPVNLPRSLLATSITPEKVTVVVTGSRNVVDSIRPEEVVARVDLSSADEEAGGLREVVVDRPVRVDVRRRGVRTEVSPEAVRVALETQVQRMVPVCVERVDVPPPGFSVEEPISTTPEEVQITGVQRDVDAVECAAASVRLSGLTVSVSPETPLQARDSNGRARGGVTITPASATVNVRIRQNFFPRQAVIDVRLSGRPAPGYAVTEIRVNPTIATVIGPLDVVSALNSVPTEVVDIEGARAETVRVVALQLPPGVTSSEQRAVVSVGIQPVRAPGTVGVAPRIVNVGSGLTATANVATVAVQLNGLLPDLAALRPGDVTVTLDANGLGPGTHRLDARVSPPSGFTVEAVTPPQVEVVIANAR